MTAGHGKIAVIHSTGAVIKGKPGHVLSPALCRRKGHQGHGAFFPFKSNRRGQVCTPLGIGRSAAYGQTIGSQQAHFGIGHGLACGNVLHKHRFRSVRSGFDTEAHVSDQQQARGLSHLLVAIAPREHHAHKTVPQTTLPL